jgi:hypothetical protein
VLHEGNFVPKKWSVTAVSTRNFVTVWTDRLKFLVRSVDCEDDGETFCTVDFCLAPWK